VIDTLVMARERYPGQRNSLDALCKRLGVDNSARDLHGGLIDAQLLAEVYLAMTSGQVALDLAFEAAPEQGGTAQVVVPVVLTRRPKVLRASEDELAAHERRLDALDKSAGGVSIWRKDDAPVAEAVAAS
jgi:DNA polymerase-3 subunit epsilon